MPTAAAGRLLSLQLLVYVLLLLVSGLCFLAVSFSGRRRILRIRNFSVKSIDREKYLRPKPVY